MGLVIPQADPKGRLLCVCVPCSKSDGSAFALGKMHLSYTHILSFYFHVCYMHIYFMHAMKHLCWFLLAPALSADPEDHNCLSLNQLIIF